MDLNVAQTLTLILFLDALAVGICVVGGQWILDRFFPEKQPVPVPVRVRRRVERR